MGARPLTEAELTEKLRFYRGIRHLSVAFAQTKTLREMDLRLKSDGELRIDRPAGFTWKIIHPSPVTVSIHGSALQIVTGEGAGARTQTLKLGDAPSDQSARSLATMVAWLDMDAPTLIREYAVMKDGENRYRFLPRKPAGSPIADLTMELSPAGHLRTLQIHEISGDTLDIRFALPRVS